METIEVVFVEFDNWHYEVMIDGPHAWRFIKEQRKSIARILIMPLDLDEINENLKNRSFLNSEYIKKILDNNPATRTLQ